MKRIVFLILAVNISYFLSSCSEDTVDLEGLGTITGTVVKEGSNEPLENVKISTNPASSTVFTNENGDYIISNIPSGEYTLTAEREGLLAQFEAVSVIADAEVEIVIEMDVETAGNRSPQAPELIEPADNAEELPNEVTLVWSASDPDEEDELEYTITLRNDENSEIQIVESITDTTYTFTDLAFNVKYFWQVSSSDNINDPVQSTTFAFETAGPPGNRVLYTRSVEGNGVIYSSNEEGGTEIRLTSLSKNSFRPRKNPNNDLIAFLQSVGSDTHLFIMNDDGSNVRQVTTQVAVAGFNLGEIDFSWDRNGAALLFPNQNKLYRINVDGSGLEQVYQTSNGNLITEVIHNDVSNITALKTNDLDGYNIEIFTINNSGTVTETVLTGVSGAGGGLDLSIDGSQLLYSYDVSGFENQSYRRLDSRVFLYNFSDDSRLDLSQDKPGGTNDLDPRFSPNEVEVILSNTSNDGISPFTLQIISIEDGENRTTIVENAFMPDWE